jgi:hypothetical protein
VLVYAGPLLVLPLAEAARGDLDSIPRAPLVVRYAVYAALIYTIVLFSDVRGSESIYFQFQPPSHGRSARPQRTVNVHHVPLSASVVPLDRCARTCQ